MGSSNGSSGKRKIGGMSGGPGEQAERAFGQRPDVTISPIEREGVSIRDAGKKRSKKTATTKTTTTKKKTKKG
jgi:hypothetical protein